MPKNAETRRTTGTTSVSAQADGQETGIHEKKADWLSSHNFNNSTWGIPQNGKQQNAPAEQSGNKQSGKIRRSK